MDVSAILVIVLAIGSIIGGQALEGKLKDIKYPLFKKSVQLIVDGADPKAVHEIFETEVEHHEETGCIAPPRPATLKMPADGGFSRPCRSFPISVTMIAGTT